MSTRFRFSGRTYEAVGKIDRLKTGDEKNERKQVYGVFKV